MTPVLCGMLCTGVVSPVRTGRRRRSGTPRVPEFTATVVRNWLKRVGVRTLFIEPGGPWENGYVESFNSKLRDELPNGEIFYTQGEAKVLIESWRVHYNTVRPHSALGYRPTAPEAMATNRSAVGFATLVPRSASPAAGQHSGICVTLGTGTNPGGRPRRPDLERGN